MKCTLPAQQGFLMGILFAALFVLALPAVAQRSPLKAISPAARQLVSSGKYAEALPELNQRLLTDSLNVELLGIRAECHLNLPGEIHAMAALSDLDKALRTVPNNPALRADRGHVYFTLHRYPEAISEMNFALSQVPNDAPLIAQRGYCYLAVNQLPQALADVTQAAKMSRNQPDFVLLMGVVQMVGGSYKDAFKTFDNLVAKNKSLAIGYALRATMRQQLHDSVGSHQDMEKSIQISPADSTIQLISALILEKDGKKAAADKRYTEILSKAKSKANFHFERGDLYLQVGDVLAAEEEWKKAASLGSTDALTRLAAHYQPHPE